MKMNRRQFLTTTLIGAGALALGEIPISSTLAAATSTDPFQLRPLGQTGIKVSLIGMGTGYLNGRDLKGLGMDTGVSLLRHAYDRGIRHFDASDAYGTHGLIGRALKSMPREKVCLCTKIEARDPKRGGDAAGAIDRFRKELDSDYIDVVLLHVMTDPKWPEVYKRQMDVMAELKSKGTIHAHGASFHSLGAMQAGLDTPWLDSALVRINGFGDSMDAKDPSVVAPVIQSLHKKGKGVVGMKLIGEGRYRNDPDRIDKSIEYALSLNSLDGMIVGFLKPEEIDDFARRVEKILKARQATTQET